MSRVPEPVRPRDLSEFHDDLKATLAARREISPEMEDALIANFLQQVERRIDARVDQRVSEVTKLKVKRAGQNTGLVAATLGLSIPLIAIAAGTTGGSAVAIVAVVTLILLINILYAFKQ